MKTAARANLVSKLKQKSNPELQSLKEGLKLLHFLVTGKAEYSLWEDSTLFSLGGLHPLLWCLPLPVSLSHCSVSILVFLFSELCQPCFPLSFVLASPPACNSFCSIPQGWLLSIWSQSRCFLLIATFFSLFLPCSTFHHVPSHHECISIRTNIYIDLIYCLTFSSLPSFISHQGSLSPCPCVLRWWLLYPSYNLNKKHQQGRAH